MPLLLSLLLRSSAESELIFEEGHALNGVYCVKDGVCKLVKMNAQGKHTILKLVTKGELLGQRTVFSNEPSNLSAVAVEDMTVCPVPDSLGNFDNSSTACQGHATEKPPFDMREAFSSTAMYQRGRRCITT